MNKGTLLILALLSGPSLAEPVPSFDPRIADTAISSKGTQRLKVPSEITQLLLFHPGEKIELITLSDPNAFFANIAGSGDSITLRASQPQGASIMNVRTRDRTYDFELLATSEAVPMVVRLLDGADRPIKSSKPVTSSFSGAIGYRLSGSRALLPSSIRDDGTKTYIEWAGDRPMPATFTLGPTGGEQMVEGYVRDGVFTIDRVYSELIFRIDRSMAKAVRQTGRKSDG